MKRPSTIRVAEIRHVSLRTITSHFRIRKILCNIMASVGSLLRREAESAVRVLVVTDIQTFS
jgi:hypothetical protein